MKRVAFFIAALTFCSVLSAQTMKYGGKIGTNLSNFYAEDQGMETFRLGYGVGAFFQYDINDYWGVSVEPMFSQKGANSVEYTNFYHENSPLFYNRVTQSYNNFSRENVSLSIIELPVLGHYMFEFAGLNARVFMGPSFDFLLKAQFLKKRIYNNENRIFTKDDITERLDYYDIGAMGGIGVDLELLPVIVRIDLSYRYGITDINNHKGKPALHNNNLALTVGIGLMDE